MSYEVLIETLINEGKNKGQDIIEKGRLETEAILREAGEKSSFYQLDRQKEVRKEIEVRTAKVLSQAKIECQRILLESKHEVLKIAFERAKERLGQWINRPFENENSRLFWFRRVKESLQGYESNDIVGFLFRDAPRDLEVILNEKGIPFEKVNDSNLWCGFKFVSENEGITIINSFSSRLDMIRQELYVDLSAVFFENGKPAG